MNINFTYTGYNNDIRLLQIDNARIIWKNFSGVGSKYNREGDRNFALVIDDQDICDALVNDKNDLGASWNVKIKPPRDEDDDPFMTLAVKVKFNGRGPNVYLESNGKTIKLDEDSIRCLDEIDIKNIDLDIRAYDDQVNGKPFRSAYLQSMHVVQNTTTDRFADRYAE